jgi:hypothetical protein
MSRTFSMAIALALLAGCANTGTPKLDDNFGYAVNAAKAQQTINPDASLNADPVEGIGGVAANETIDRYHDTFKTPPPPITVINVGGGLSGSGGGGR